jgi:hypothetical protein
MTGRAPGPTGSAGELALWPLRFVLQLWPLWLTWPALELGNIIWRDGVLAAFTDHASPAYRLAYAAWPSMALLGPVALLLLAAGLQRAHRAPRLTVIAGLVGTAGVILLLLRPEWGRLAPYLGHVPVFVLLRAVDPAYLHAFALGTLGLALGGRLLREGPTRRSGLPLQRARSDNHGHADWLSLHDAQRLSQDPTRSTAASSSARPTASTRTPPRPGRSTPTSRRAGAGAAPPRCSSTPAAPAPPTPSSSPAPAASRPPPPPSPRSSPGPPARSSSTPPARSARWSGPTARPPSASASSPSTPATQPARPRSTRSTGSTPPRRWPRSTSRRSPPGSPASPSTVPSSPAPSSSATWARA